jgi:hypothetical protein
MSEEPTSPDLVEIARGIWMAVNRPDWDAMLSFYASDACLDMSPVGLGTFAGRAAAERFAEEQA